MKIKLKNDQNIRLRGEENITIPSEYQELEYFESSGTQYIDTGIKVSEFTKIRIEFKPLLTEGYINLVGSSNGLNSLSRSKALFLKNGKIALGFEDNIIESEFIPELKETYILEATIKSGQQEVKINNETIISDTLEETTFILNSNNVALFNISFSGNINEGDGFYGQFKRITFYNENTVVKDLIPVYRKIDMKVGLFDIIGSTSTAFYPGNGNFRIGNDKINQEISENAKLKISSIDINNCPLINCPDLFMKIIEKTGNILSSVNIIWSDIKRVKSSIIEDIKTILSRPGINVISGTVEISNSFYETEIQNIPSASTVTLDNGKKQISISSIGTNIIYDPENCFIDFENSKVDEICKDNFDINDDGGISKNDIEIIKDFEELFKDQDIESFKEVNEFINLEKCDFSGNNNLSIKFNNLSNLKTIKL